MARFSLIVATVERMDPLKKLLASLAEQSHRDFEIIIVDQNLDDRVDRIVKASPQPISIQHLRSERGLSRARNAGLRAAQGELLCFPDDDCWYGPEFLRAIDRWFQDHLEYGFLSTCARNADGEPTAGRWLAKSAEITRSNVFRANVSFSLFFRSSAACTIGFFDEQLGLGSGTPYGSAEETDYVLRVLESGHRGWYEHSFAVFHPQPARIVSSAVTARAYSYGAGFGYVLRRHRIPLLRSLYLCLRPAGGWLRSVVFDRSSAAVFSATLRGRLGGYFRSEDS